MSGGVGPGAAAVPATPYKKVKLQYNWNTHDPGKEKRGFTTWRLLSNMTERDHHVALLQAVKGVLDTLDAVGLTSRRFEVLRAAYDAAIADPVAEAIASGEFERMHINVPRGMQITILGPSPCPGLRRASL